MNDSQGTTAKQQDRIVASNTDSEARGHQNRAGNALHFLHVRHWRQTNMQDPSEPRAVSLHALLAEPAANPAKLAKRSFSQATKAYSTSVNVLQIA